MESQLTYLNDSDRLKAYQAIVDGCSHLWSKNKLQKDKLASVMDTFAMLAEKDPYFLAHFTSYAIKKLPSKDLKVVATFVNSLSDADGTPFAPGSKFNKPNLRAVSQAALQDMDPKLVTRVMELANTKMKVGSKRDSATHFSRSLKTAVKKYLKFREENPRALEGIRKAGFSNTVKNIYRNVHVSPSVEAAGMLNWPQKDGRQITVKKDLFDFSGMTDLQIAHKIRENKLPPQGALGALPGKISPVVAVAILEQASGDQAVVLTTMFEDQGLLKNKEVKKVYTEKVKTAKTALDRVERFQKELDEDLKQSLKTVKAAKRKEDVGDVGKVFLHIDISSSMDSALTIAKDSGATLAECVKNPVDNFHWGVFHKDGKVLPTPTSFEKDAFQQVLYGIRANGMTNCMALYEEARRRKCDVDVYITDQDHNCGDVQTFVLQAAAKGLGKPKAAVIVNVNNPGNRFQTLKKGLESAGIPVSEISVDALKESALVSQAIKSALLGANAVIEEIMSEPLLTLPNWWYSVKVN